MDGKELARSVRQNVDKFKSACADIDEDTASRAPENRWSPKEIVSHLIGPQNAALLSMFTRFIDEDTPEIDIESGNPYFIGDRERMTFSDLLSRLEKEYSSLADFVARLSPDQLERKAHIPDLKDSPLGEYPTLGAFVGALTDYHIGFHIDHLQEILASLKR